MQQFAFHIARLAGAFLLLCISFTTVSAQGDPLGEARIAAANKDYTEAARLYEQALKNDPEDEKILVEAGDVNMELERYQTARDLYARAFEEDGRDPEINRKYGTVLSMLGQPADAVEKLQRAVKYDDGSLESRLALGRAYIRADSMDKAELTILSSSKDFPDSPLPPVALGDLYFAQGIYLLADSQYTRALRLDEALLDSRVKLGRAYREQAKRSATLEEANEYYNRALKQFNEVTRRYPKNARAWREQGEIFLLAKEYEKAGTSFQQYVELRPEDPNGDIYLAQAAYEGNFFTLAVEPAKRILAKTDSLSQAFAPQAQAMVAKGYYAQAQSATKDGRADSARMLYQLASNAYGTVQDTLLKKEDRVLYGFSILQGGGDTAKAIGIYRALVNEFPNDCDLSIQIGSRLYTMKRYQDVIEIFTKRNANCPDVSSASPYLYIGLSNYTLGNFPEAITALNSSIAADSTMTQAYYWLMNVYANGKVDKVDSAAHIADLMIARGMAAENPKEVGMGYYFKGVSKFESKEYKAAIDELQKSIELNEDFSASYLFTAFCYQFLNEKSNACKYYKLTLQHDPDNATAKKNMASLGC